ncbi:ATP-binding protein [Pseudomonas paralactis]|uniref:ATP-binding protein n=1 Tax=Pseudomonas paralactis TaxID=1615673 RepID=A0ABS0UWB8_9PSED|nr:ATP-binding protein [Pseudomonas paralactis]MBI6632310.1 ATP-binding protein [Pseudomonas paralactis]
MADLLVRHLKVKAEEHSALRSLYSQWDFDEKLIPKALQTIGSLFPHYSRHDESHSKQILVNIERLLGDNVNLLTATDTWLLLESAYWHDIGMVVPYDDFQEAIDDPEFQEFVQSICAQPNHELHSLACAFTIKAHPTLIFECSTPLEMVSKFREFMAEWFRRKHPTRAEQIVRAPMATVGISSPRTELIPARLFKLLGRICQMHGAPFADLISERGLPFREAGLAQDDCHPRFVACMLRMGDLLDLDDNRFCPVMQRIAGDERSKVSKAHEDKHAGMRHLRIDQERIEVTAECETIDGYLEAFRWFDWLKKEVQDQRANWRDIVPNRELGLLPMLGPVSVRLGGNLQILKDGERPAFSIDANKAIELLQGNNLYESRFACVRELLQNAVDATLLRTWLVNRKKYDAEFWGTPDKEEMRALFGSAVIFVDLVESAHTETEKNKKSLWTLTVRDEGTGISREDLEYMLRIGGSQNNKARQREINQMPEWMKPSGTFGIGLQSVFMLCNEVSILTKSLFTNEIFDVTMYSPTGPEEGMVVLRRLSDDISFPHGTSFKLTFELDVFAKIWSESRSVESITSQVVSTMDPVLDERFPFEAASLADQIIVFGKHSLVPVRGSMTALHGQFEIQNTERELEGELELNPWKFIKTEQAEAKIWYEPNVGIHPSRSMTTFYRGQEFETKDVYFPSVRIAIDLMSGKAGSWLNFNRDKASSSAREMIESTVLACLQSAVEDDLRDSGQCDLLSSVQKRAEYSHFLKSMALAFQGEWIAISNQLGDAWLDCTIEGKDKKYRDLFKLSDWTVGIKQSDLEPEEKGRDLFIGDGGYGRTLSIILTEWVKTPGNTVKIAGSDSIYKQRPSFVGPEKIGGRQQRERIERAQFRNHYRLRGAPQELWDKSALATELASAMALLHGNRRYLLCVQDLFKSLALSSGTKIRARKIFPNLVGEGDQILLPFLFLGHAKQNGVTVESTPAQIDALCRWTQSRLSHSASFETIRCLYGDVINFIDNEVMRPTVYWERWRRARGLSEDSM